MGDAARRTEVAATVETLVAELRANLGRAGFAEWRELVETLFPREGGYSVTVWPDGRIRLHGALPLDARGEERLRRGRGNPSRHPGGTCSIPVSLEAVAAARRRPVPLTYSSRVRWESWPARSRP